VSRQADPVRHSYTEGLRALVDLLARLIPSRSRSKKRARALAMLSGWVGAIILSRAVDDQDLSDEILKAASASAW
jgi:TetR/AcrR family transcriptional repressor of nem operon